MQLDGMFAVFFLARMGFKQIGRIGKLAGLYQRLALIIGFTWIALLAVYLLRPPAAQAR